MAASVISKSWLIRTPILLGVDWDVTSLRQLDADFAAPSDLLRVTLRSVGEAVITTDDVVRIPWVNLVADAMGRLLGDVFVIHKQVTGVVAPDPVQIALHGERIWRWRARRL